MYSLLMSDSAERAVSDPCDGAATAAAGSAVDTVTVSVMFATVRLIATSSAMPSDARTPVRRTISNPGTATSIVYIPEASPVIEKRPTVSVDVVRISLVASFRTMTAAFTTTLDSGSSTLPLSVDAPGAADCAKTVAVHSSAHRDSASPHLRSCIVEPPVNGSTIRTGRGGAVNGVSNRCDFAVYIFLVRLIGSLYRLQIHAGSVRDRSRAPACSH